MNDQETIQKMQQEFSKHERSLQNDIALKEKEIHQAFSVKEEALINEMASLKEKIAS
jgi:hypothetical protein